MENTMRPFLAMAALLALCASPAHAHLSGAIGNGISDGLAHPFLGLDHVLAMVSVGLWAVQIGGRALMLLPVLFPTLMTIGAALALAGVSFPGVELVIASSVVALGVAILLGLKPPLTMSSAAVAVFALAHGHAHGAELTESVSAIAYGAGFVVATIALHLIGVALGAVVLRSDGARQLRYAGAAVAIAGGALVYNVV